MPLPTVGSFPVLGYSRPGEAVQSKPKQAMIVRMTPETLDALQDFPNNPPMEFQFGSNPGIYIGDTFFPMAPTSESAPHDLYLRASSATKKTPPFKLHANVVGRFTVQRELVPSVGEKVRVSTNEAISQRANRTTIMIDDPKELLNATAQAKHKKKKEAPATSLLQDKSKSKANAAAPRPSKNPVSSVNPLDKLSPEKAQGLRRRLIHFLAPEDRSEDEVVRAVGGPNCTSQIRHAVCHVLEEVGELLGKGSKQYRLKMRSWTEVRPYEWANWSEAIRTKVVRNARGNLKALGIQESDPIWSHFTPPSNGPSSSSSQSRMSSGGRETPEPRRATASRDAREKAPTATKTGRKSDIMAKDESRSGSRGVRDNSPGEISRVASSSSSANAARKQPGSGFKSTATSSKLSNSIDADPPPRKLNDMRPPPIRDAPSTSSQSSTSKSRAIPRSRGLGDESMHESDNERKRSLHSSLPSKLSQSARVADDYRDSDTERRRHPPPVERERERNRERGRESDRERERDRERRKERETSYSRVKDIKREREEGETSDASVRSAKRKARFQGDDDDFYPSKAAQKRRKTEAVSSSLPPKPQVEEREPHQSSRAPDADSQHRSKVKREASPTPSLSNHKRPRSPPPKRPVTTPVTASQAGSSSNHATGTKSVKSKPPLKFRRGSSIYTSSEDEGELPQSTRSRPEQRSAPIPKTLPPLPPGPPPLPPPQTSQLSSSTPLNMNGTGRVPSSLRAARSAPAPYTKGKGRRASLRERYSEAYVQYMETMSKLASERNKIEKMVREYDRLSTGSVTDSEGDAMAHEELAELAARHRKKHQELDNIRREFEVLDSGTGGSSE